MEKERVAKTLVKPKGVFDLKDLYKFLYEYISALGYFINEDHYNQKLSATGKDVEFVWNCFQEIDGYTKLEIQVMIKVFGMNDVQVERGGVKKQMNQGDVEVWLYGFINTDYRGQWEKQPLLKFLKGIYDRYIYRSRFEALSIKVWEDTFSIENEVKAYFEMPRFM